jgi:hypothetical protein
MSIWGRRDSEPSAEEAREGQAAEARDGQAGEVRDGQAETQDRQEPAAEHQAGEPAPAFWRAQGEAPAPLERDPADGETVVKDPAPAVAPEPAATQAQEPAVAMAHEPAMTEAQEPAVPGPRDEALPTMAEAEQQQVRPEPAVAEAEQQPVTPEPAATGAGPPAAAMVTPQRWSEILVAFVDDPRGSVKMAADAVDEAFGEFVKTVRLRQRDLASTWQSAGADTEQLRTALREYRKLGQRVQQLDLGEKTGV